MNRKGNSILSKVFHRLRNEGSIQTFRWLFGAAFYYPALRWLDSRFDRKFGVETQSLKHRLEFEMVEKVTAHAKSYEPIPERLFLKYIAQIDLNWPEYSFVDLGCGKGRALMLATRWPFKNIIGVEFEPTIFRTCAENVQKFMQRAHQLKPGIKLICGDAGDFMFPDGNILLFLYNPFDNTIMEKVCRQLEASIKTAPRNIRIVYFHPNASASIDNLKNVRRIAYEIVHHRGSIDNKWPVAIYAIDAKSP